MSKPADAQTRYDEIYLLVPPLFDFIVKLEQHFGEGIYDGHAILNTPYYLRKQLQIKKLPKIRNPIIAS